MTKNESQNTTPIPKQGPLSKSSSQMAKKCLRSSKSSAEVAAPLAKRQEVIGKIIEILTSTPPQLTETETEVNGALGLYLGFIKQHE